MKHRLLIVGAGRIGAGYEWSDLAYTHAGASQALRDRIELVGFVEPNNDRAIAAKLRWQVPVIENLTMALDTWEPDVVSVCVQPGEQHAIMAILDHTPSVKAVWCEKPYTGYPASKPVQVNYMRRGDQRHRDIANYRPDGKLIVYGKDDIHTRCHFEDLAKWWRATLDYRTFNGGCAYLYEAPKHCRVSEDNGLAFFDNGGVGGGECFKAMLGNLLDHVDIGTTLWSPAT